MRIFISTTFATVVFPVAAAFAQFPDARDKPLKGWNGPVFHLSQSYPKTVESRSEKPWKTIDFKSDWEGYLSSVLRYAMEGNIEVDWVGQQNSVRKWYHAPWMHWGRNGREFIHGLTHERVSQPGELAQTQTAVFQNWAVGLYNAPGGYTIGQVWADPNAPDPSKARFADGTVSIKLLFTSATVDQVPYLTGAKEWDGYIYETAVIPTNPLLKRKVQKLRLLQIDLAVRDDRADSTTGWVFGTFTYNGNLPGTELWRKFVPVGLMWGNDPGVKVVDVRRGRKLAESLSYTSPDVPYQHLGWAGRINGPVDNPMSSCLSCHATAQWPAYAPVVPPRDVRPDSEEWLKWFRNVKDGEAFSPGAVSLGYSLQLSAGIANFYEWKAIVATLGGAVNSGSSPKNAEMMFLLDRNSAEERRVYEPSRQE